MAGYLFSIDYTYRANLIFEGIFGKACVRQYVNTSCHLCQGGASGGNTQENT